MSACCSGGLRDSREVADFCLSAPVIVSAGKWHLPSGPQWCGSRDVGESDLSAAVRVKRRLPTEKTARVLCCCSVSVGGLGQAFTATQLKIAFYLYICMTVNKLATAMQSKYLQHN